MLKLIGGEISWPVVDVEAEQEKGNAEKKNSNDGDKSTDDLPEMLRGHCYCTCQMSFGAFLDFDPCGLVVIPRHCQQPQFSPENVRQEAPVAEYLGYQSSVYERQRLGSLRFVFATLWN